MFADAAPEHDRLGSVEYGEIGADVFAHAITEESNRQSRLQMSTLLVAAPPIPVTDPDRNGDGDSDLSEETSAT